MKIIYMGTGDIALAPLKKLYESGHEIACVVTQPDRPNTRRGKNIEFGVVKRFALDEGLTLYQPEKISGEEAFDFLKAFNAQVVVVCSFGQLLKENVLNMCPYGCINIHTSLLPAYRGAAPIARAIMNSEKQSGVSVMYMDEGLDTGDIMIARSVDITEQETSGSLSEKLKQCGAELICEALELLNKKTAPRIPQDDGRASYAEKIYKKDKHVSFDRSAAVVSCHIRALDPLPCAEASFAGKTVKLFGASVCDITPPKENKPFGSVVSADNEGIVISCREGFVKVSSLKPEGKAQMAAKAFWNGVKDKSERFV